MKHPFRRPASSSLLSARSTLVIFIVTITVIATFNLLPQTLYLGLPQSDNLTGTHSIKLGGGNIGTAGEAGKQQIIEHTFSDSLNSENDHQNDPETSELLTDNIAAAAAVALDKKQRQGDAGVTKDSPSSSSTKATAKASLDSNQPVRPGNTQKKTTTTTNRNSGKATSTSHDSNKTYEDKYHIVVSVSDGLYTEWQVRVCYYWYKRMKEMYPDSAMGGFTRLLHSGVEDEWMDEIPTVVVDPLPPKLQEIANGYVVLNRPYAFQQWVRDYLPDVPERYILMAEPDHLFIKPPPLWATPTKAAAFPFFYIEPQAPENEEIVQRYNPKKIPIEKFAPIGNSPVMIARDHLEPIINRWTNLSLTIKQDRQADMRWGWVQEMYAFSIASALDDAGPVEYSLHPEFMLQPPWDETLQSSENGKDAAIIHYTYGFDFDEHGVFTPGKVGTWHWDKRDYMGKYPPANFPLPPEGCTNEAVITVVKAVNEAAAALPGWAERAYKDVDEVTTYYADQMEDEEEEEEQEEETYVGGDGIVEDEEESRRRRQRRRATVQ